jgi:3-hydroxyisobutyrate dehydrogenase
VREQETVAVLGAGGIMGKPIARNLARDGFTIRAWNRTPQKAESLAEHGAALLSSPREAADGANVILTMLSDGDAVLEAMSGEGGALAGARGGATWLQMSTIGLEATDRCIALAEAHDLGFIDAPVLGTREPAQQRQLVVMASGPSELCSSVEPILEALGKRTLWLGEAGAGTRLKVAVNSWILAVVEGAAETLALAEGLGVDPEKVLDVVSGGPLDLPYLQMKGKAIIDRDFAPSFRLALAAKDARLAEQAARRSGLDLPLVEVIRERLEEGSREHGDEDMSATFLTSAPAA